MSGEDEITREDALEFARKAEDAAFRSTAAAIQLHDALAATRAKVPDFGKANAARQDKADARAAEARRLRDSGLSNREIREAMRDPETGRMPSPRSITNWLRPSE